MKPPDSHASVLLRLRASRGGFQSWADFLHFFDGMDTPRPMSIIWRKGKWRCELWAAGVGEGEGYQLKLFRDIELVRLQDVPLLVYTQLAFSWKLELESAGSGNA